MTEIAKDIGLEDQLITNKTGQSYIYAKNKLYPIPGGSILEYRPTSNHFSKPN